MGKILEGLEERTVDTDLASGNRSLLIGVVDVAADGKLSGFHVTDDPEAVAKSLERGEIPGSRHSSNCGGLVVSARPKDFKNLSRKRWNFLKELGEDKRILLADLIETHLRHQEANRYITVSEFDRGIEGVVRWLETANLEMLMPVTLQPYNIDIPEIVGRNGLAEVFKPYIVTVIFEGRYLESSHETQWWSIPLAAHHLKKPERDIDMADLCRTWKDLGWDGVFFSGRSQGHAELSIWNPAKILSYGTSQETTRLSGLSARRSGSSGRLSAPPPRLSGKDAAEGGTTQEGRRFMSSISPSMKMAMIQEISDRSRMFGPMRLPAMTELKETVERLRMGLEPYPGRFKVDVSKDLPEIVDTEVYRRIRTLSSEDIGELSYLIDEILTEMEP